MKDHVILFDGVCNLCNASVRFILKNDGGDKFYFATLQSEFVANHDHCFEYSIEDPDTVIYIRKDHVYYRSKAVIEILRDLGGFYKVFLLFLIFPESFRDFLYRFVANNRYKWFGKMDACPIVPEKWKDRFLD